MNNRYEEVTESVTEMLRRVQDAYFPELVNAKIKALFDKKKRISGGQFTLACILKPNELIKHFTSDERLGLDDGYDYIIIIDKVCWENAGHIDRERMIRHELRHTFFDINADDNPYKLIDHSVSDFYEEMELNRDDPKWKLRLASVMESIYEQQKEDAKRRGKGRKAPVHTGPTPLEEVNVEKRAEREE